MLALRTPELALAQVGQEHGQHLAGDVVLQGEEFEQFGVEPPRPSHHAELGVGELRRYTQTTFAAADAAREDVADPELLGDRARVWDGARVPQRRTVGDYEQLLELRQRPDDLLDDAIGEVALDLRAPAHGGRATPRSKGRGPGVVAVPLAVVRPPRSPAA